MRESRCAHIDSPPLPPPPRAIHLLLLGRARQLCAIRKGRVFSRRYSCPVRVLFARVFYADKKNVTHKLSPAAIPAYRASHRYQPCRRSMPGRAMVVVYSFFSFFKKNDVFIDAMYSDTATLTLKYHIWRHIMIRL